MMKNKMTRRAVLIGAMVLVSFWGGWVVKARVSNTRSEVTYDNPPLRGKDQRYKFISPLLACGVLGNEEFREFEPLKTQLKQMVDKKVYTKEAKTISIYFRDLDRGRRVAINEDEKYFPASLLKVPLMITYFKLGEKEPAVLNERIVYDGSFDVNAKEDIGPTQAIQAGRSYTAEELIKAMIVYSDNNATKLIFDSVDKNFLSEVGTDISVYSPAPEGSIDVMSAKYYSYFFRVLYNATYLNKEMSEKALDLLSQSDFKKGIRAGVPFGTQVAEKFGESTIYAREGAPPIKELHDCGIVYFSKGPYLLCVMTKGDNFDNLSRTIQDVSELVYKGVSAPGY
ncbi:MAG: serine hydrolase [Candidatus Liptonbacteria bacterium]|nr:serine hydrolase [Candidatus Liptonbacteria bacterium]